MNKPQIVLDSSATLAFVFDETGADEVRLTIRQGLAAMSTVNYSEMLAKIAGKGGDPLAFHQEWLDTGILHGLIGIVGLDLELAIVTSLLRPVTRSAGLSFGERACLALGRTLGLPVLTADRRWRDVDCGVEVRLLR